MRGRVNVREEEINVRCESLTSLSSYRLEQARRLTVTVRRDMDPDSLPRLVGVVSQHPGECDLAFRVTTATGSTVLMDAGVKVRPSEAFMEELEGMLGHAEYRFDYPHPEPGQGNGNRPRNGNGRPRGRPFPAAGAHGAAGEQEGAETAAEPPDTRPPG